MTTWGFESKMMGALSRSLNFVPRYQGVSDGKYFGIFIKENGTFDGILGDLQNGRTDIGLVNLWVRVDSFPYVDFGTPYNYDGFCFGMPLPRDSRDYLALLRPMSMESW